MVRRDRGRATQGVKLITLNDNGKESIQEITLVIPDDSDGEPAEGIDDTEGGESAEGAETSESAESPAEE